MTNRTAKTAKKTAGKAERKMLSASEKKEGLRKVIQQKLEHAKKKGAEEKKNAQQKEAEAAKKPKRKTETAKKETKNRMTNAIKALAQWKESIPQDGLLDFCVSHPGAYCLFYRNKTDRMALQKSAETSGKIGSDEAAKSFLLSGIKIGLHLILILTIAGNLGVDKTSVGAALVGSAGVAISSGFGGRLIQFCRRTDHHVPAPVFRWRLHHRKWKKTEGTVQKIELYYTTLMTIDSRRIVIPNSVLTNDSITTKRRWKKKTGDQSGNFL